jgi:hypothetical protein
LAHGQAGLGEEGVVGGAERLREGSRLGHRHGGGNGQGEPLVQESQFSLGGPTQQPHYPVPGRERPHLATHLLDYAGTLHTGLVGRYPRRWRVTPGSL